MGGCVCLGHTDNTTKLKTGFVPQGRREVLVKLAEECVVPVGLDRLVAVFSRLSSIPTGWQMLICMYFNMFTT